MFCKQIDAQQLDHLCVRSRACVRVSMCALATGINTLTPPASICIYAL